jgi:hypothetical protein
MFFHQNDKPISLELLSGSTSSGSYRAWSQVGLFLSMQDWSWSFTMAAHARGAQAAAAVAVSGLIRATSSAEPLIGAGTAESSFWASKA